MNFETIVVILVAVASLWAIVVASSRGSTGEWKFKDPFRPWRG